MSLLAGLAFIALLVAAGWWPSRALLPWMGGGWAGRAAVACACGAAAAGLLQVALGAVGVPAGWIAPAVLAGASLGSGARVRLPPSTASSLPRPVAALLLLVAVVGTGVAVGTPFRSDGSKFWAPKARELARFGADVAPALHDPARLAVHRDYPLLVPSLLAPVFAASPPDATSGPKLVLAALQLALLGTLAALLGRRGAAGALMLAAVAAAPLLVSLDVRESVAAGGYADGAVALLLLLVVACVQRLREQADVRTAVAAAVFGGALVACKTEGGVELAIVLGAWLACGPRRGWPLGVAAGALLLAVPTFVLRAGVAPEEPGFATARLLDPATAAARGLPVAAGVGGLLLDASCFALLPALVGLRLARGRSRFAGLLVAGALAFLVVSYLCTIMDAGRHIQTSAHRLAWHWLPALAFLGAEGSDDEG